MNMQYIDSIMEDSTVSPSFSFPTPMVEVPPPSTNSPKNSFLQSNARRIIFGSAVVLGAFTALFCKKDSPTPPIPNAEHAPIEPESLPIVESNAAVLEQLRSMFHDLLDREIPPPEKVRLLAVCKAAAQLRLRTMEG